MGMEEKVGELMGEAVSHTAIVSPKGQGGKIMLKGAATQAAGVIGAMVADSKTKRPPSAPGGHQGGYMVMALGERNIAFFEAKSGLIGRKAGKLLVTHPRSDVVSMELGGGTLTKELTVEFADGTNYPLEVPRANVGGAEKLIQAWRGG